MDTDMIHRRRPGGILLRRSAEAEFHPGGMSFALSLYEFHWAGPSTIFRSYGVNRAGRIFRISLFQALSGRKRWRARKNGRGWWCYGISNWRRVLTKNFCFSFLVLLPAPFGTVKFYAILYRSAYCCPRNLLSTQKFVPTLSKSHANLKLHYQGKNKFLYFFALDYRHLVRGRQ